MSNFDIASQQADGMGPHGVKVGLLRVLGPAHVWALGVGIVLVGEYMGWNFAVGKGGARMIWYIAGCVVFGCAVVVIALVCGAPSLDTERRD